MNGFFEELDFVARYLSPKGEPCKVYTFSSDRTGDESNRMMKFRARFAVRMPANNPYTLIERHGLPNLYYAWGKRQERLPDDIKERAHLFEEWLRDAPEEEIKAALPLKPLEEYQ